MMGGSVILLSKLTPVILNGYKPPIEIILGS